MRKRKINPEYLRHITSSDVKDEELDALDFALTVKSFAEGYLAGIMAVSVRGDARGKVSLKLPVVSYLMRLLCEGAGSDEMIDLDISLGDEVKMTAGFEQLPSVDSVAHIVKVAQLAGFDVTRHGEALTFAARVHLTSIMQIYAVSGDEFKSILITTFKM